MSRDLGVTETVRTTSPEWAEAVFQVLTVLGEWKLVVPLLGFAYLADVWSSLRDSGGRASDQLCSDRTVVLVAAVFGGLALTLLLKGLIDAPRPPAEWQAVPATGGGVPSGHTMTATVFWGALVIWAPVSTRVRRAIVAATIVVLVAVTRVGLGVHFVVDVVAGIGFGALYLLVYVALVDENPWTGLALAGLIAVLGVFLTSGSTRALLGLFGVVGATVGWRFVEWKPVRTALATHVGPLVAAGSPGTQERI